VEVDAVGGGVPAFVCSIQMSLTVESLSAPPMPLT
jgi:hypothetical protein